MREEKSKSTNEMKSMLSSIFQSVLASSSKNLVVASSYKFASLCSCKSLCKPSNFSTPNDNHLRLMLHQMMYSVSTVVLFTLAMAAATGLGAVPFFFVKLDPHWPGICNGMAAGVMLAASFELVNMLCITGCICDEV
ncbi:unnamed protein product [Brassica oleracea var. botrytis]|uniref:Uncharacterized protein n=1 Tax=Brassica oleracea var. oleracea TaxID=109376 RepID=A0A0D3AVD0_BRAOL